MPSNTASPPTYSREDFCLALKAVRERRKVTLDHIAEVTKIPASVFSALERGDLRNWPKGLFGRSFFRAYVEMIGLPVDKACAEFLRLFGEEKPEEPPVPAEPIPHSRAAWMMWKMRALFAAFTERPTRVAPAVVNEKWVTDARRVGDPPSKTMRVRIKLPR
jgi:hypothetical protein